MTADDIIRERVEFLKLEYQQIREHNAHLENAEWTVRQLSFTLWLAAVAVGLGLQGLTTNNFYILVASLFIPYIFLYMDARIGRWISGHRSRRRQIELFLSNPDYTVPSTGKKISFTEFCSNLDKSYHFPVLDPNGSATLGKDGEYNFYTQATFPHMTVGLRRYFYQSQILGSLIIISIQLYNIYQMAWIFSLVAVGPLIYWMIAISTRIGLRRVNSLKLARHEGQKVKSIIEDASSRAKVKTSSAKR